jgi:hypothetical protein
MTAAVDTRRLYAFEGEYLRGTALTRPSPMEELRAFASFIWDSVKSTGDCPTIVAGPGVKYLGARYSYCQGKYIQLARNQRNDLTLIHELVHALGHGEHDNKFVRMYRRLLLDYTSITPKSLDYGLKQYKLL